YFIQKIKAAVIAGLFITLALVFLAIFGSKITSTISSEVESNTHIVQTEILRKYEKLTEGLFGAKTEYYIEIEFEGVKKSFPIKQTVYDQINTRDLVTATIKYGEIDSMVRDEK